MNVVTNEEIAKVIIKVGAVIAGSDGLEAHEKAALVSFATERSRLPLSVIESQVSAASAGLESITDSDITTLKSLGNAQIGRLLHEGLQKIAGADGNLSEKETAALKSVWARLA